MKHVNFSQNASYFSYLSIKLVVSNVLLTATLLTTSACDSEPQTPRIKSVEFLYNGQPYGKIQFHYKNYRIVRSDFLHESHVTSSDIFHYQDDHLSRVEHQTIDTESGAHKTLFIHTLRRDSDSRLTDIESTIPTDNTANYQAHWLYDEDRLATENYFSSVDLLSYTAQTNYHYDSEERIESIETQTSFNFDGNTSSDQLWTFITWGEDGPLEIKYDESTTFYDYNDASQVIRYQTSWENCEILYNEDGWIHAQNCTDNDGNVKVTRFTYSEGEARGAHIPSPFLTNPNMFGLDGRSTPSFTTADQTFGFFSLNFPITNT